MDKIHVSKELKMRFSSLKGFHFISKQICNRIDAFQYVFKFAGVENLRIYGV